MDKGRNDLVTAADIEAENWLRPQLASLLDKSVALGEESVHEDPKLLNALKNDVPVWIIDPVDGTRAFAKGEDAFCIIVALAFKDETIGGWIYQPTSNEITSVEKGAGAFQDGKLLKIDRGVDLETRKLRAALYKNYLPKKYRAGIEAFTEEIEDLRPKMCAGLEHRRLAQGEVDITAFWMAKNWDHAAGVLTVQEAGGASAFVDGTPYSPSIFDKHGLLSVANPDSWEPLRDRLFPDKWM